MTSASLFFKLQKEDLKRRIWVIALLFLGFFFAYPVNLALIMENAANSQFAMYNGYTPLVDTGTPEYLAKVLEYKTKAVVDLVSYGNVMPLFLMVTAAVVINDPDMHIHSSILDEEQDMQTKEKMLAQVKTHKPILDEYRRKYSID